MGQAVHDAGSAAASAGGGTARRTVAVIGGGPRGTSVVERLVSRAAAAGGVTGAGLSVLVIDPHEPGPGHVWATSQNRLFLMNTQSFYPTVAPERPASGEAPEPRAGGFAESTGAAGPTGPAVREAGPRAPGLSFEQFRRSGGDGAQLSEVERGELGALGREDFPPRALYGAYLRHVYLRTAALAATVPGLDGPHHVRGTAVVLEPEGERYRIDLDDGRALHADDVVLALGHVPARLTPEQEAAGRAAAERSSAYVAPHVPEDLDPALFPAGQTVLVRGMGLNFFDLMAAVTEGRGGRFEPTGQGPGRCLRYVASGQEPVLVAGSRRGTPYRAKAEVDAFVPRSVHLRHLTHERIAAAARNGAPGRLPGTVDFERHVWPLLHRDVVEHYYRTLADQSPELFAAGSGGFLDDLAAVLDAPAEIGDEVWTARAEDLLRQAAPEADFFDIRRLAFPFSGVAHTSTEGHTAAVSEWLEQDAAGAALGEASPEHVAIGALHAGRLLVKRFVAEGLIDEPAVATQVRGWFEPMVEGLASGPPRLRTEQLAALVRAGVVRILGPEPTYTFDADSGLFRAASAWVETEPETARWMVEAMMPANRVAITASPLLRGVLAAGLGRPHPRVNSDGEPVPGSGLDVTGPDHRLVGEGRRVAEHVHVLGLQLSSVQWGTAIAAEAGAGPQDGGRTLADADAVAATVLERAGVERGEPTEGDWVLP